MFSVVVLVAQLPQFDDLPPGLEPLLVPLVLVSNVELGHEGGHRDDDQGDEDDEDALQVVHRELDRLRPDPSVIIDRFLQCHGSRGPYYKILYILRSEGSNTVRLG